MQMSARQRSKSMILRTQYRKLTPAGATPEGIQRALELCDKPVQRRGKKSDFPRADCLQNLVEVGEDSTHAIPASKCILSIISIKLAQEGLKLCFTCKASHAPNPADRPGTAFLAQAIWLCGATLYICKGWLMHQ
ncbi:hypothetical protein ABBQ38_013090 [Trebouxia sp. C0009 RCD-2024]